LKGSLLSQDIVTTPTGVIAFEFPLQTVTLGDRPATAASIFLRYRFKSIIAKFTSQLPVITLGNYAVGFADDSNSGATLISAAQVVALRRSKMVKAYNNFMLSWSPIDKSKWYYTDFLAGDVRFVVPSAFFMSTQNSINLTIPSTPEHVGTLDFHYVIEYEGATTAVV